MITKLNEAPPHSLSVTLQHSDGTETVLGDQATPGAIQRDFSNQNDHSLTYFFESDEWVENVESIDVTYQSFDDTYGYDLYEVRTFGTSKLVCVGGRASSSDACLPALKQPNLLAVTNAWNQTINQASAALAGAIRVCKTRFFANPQSGDRGLVQIRNP